VKEIEKIRLETRGYKITTHQIRRCGPFNRHIPLSLGYHPLILWIRFA